MTVIMPVRNGPVQGAAMRPMTRPMTNAPLNPTPPTVESLLLRPDGSASSKAPNIDAASAVKRSARPSTTNAFESAEPISLPLSAETIPIGVKSAAMPSTNVAESAAPRRRDFASVAPKIETVIGTIGYTHGVRLAMKPKPNDASTATIAPCFA